jgi:hypothetical protein
MPDLFVFLHGLTVVREVGDWLEVVLPRVKGHVYRAGGWLAETDIAPRAELVLRGTTPGGTATVANTNFTIQLPGLPLTSRRRAATLLVPKPTQILGLLFAAPVGPAALPLATSNNGKIVVPTLPSVLVFQYSFTNPQDVRLENHPWQPYAVDDSISLHIIATSPLPEPKQHDADTNKAMAKLMPGYPGFTFNQSAQPEWQWTATPSYGSLGGLTPVGDRFEKPGGGLAFLQAELEHFASRTQRVALLARLYQENRRLKFAWTVPAPLGMDPSNCVNYST